MKTVSSRFLRVFANYILSIFFTLTFFSNVLGKDTCYITNIDTFLDQCPTLDPAISQILSDFTIKKDGVEITAFTCIEPVSSLPIAEYSDGLVLLQGLRTIYYMDKGRNNHLPWTSLSLYDWLKSKIGGFNISTTATYDSCCGVWSDGTKFFTIRAGDDSNREHDRTWRGIAGNIALMMHETRHVDGFPHTGCCPVGGSGCDQRYDETNLSPYGIQYWLFRNWLEGNLHTGFTCLSTTRISTIKDSFRGATNRYVNRFCEDAPPELNDTNNPLATCDSSCAPKLPDKIREYFRFFNVHQPGFAVSVDGPDFESPLLGTVGKAALGPNPTDINTDTPFYSGSIAKMFTAMAILQLLEQGEFKLHENDDLGLDHPVIDILPDGNELDWPKKDGWESITLKDLVMHTSGIRDYLTLPLYYAECFWAVVIDDRPCRGPTNAEVFTSLVKTNPSNVGSVKYLNTGAPPQENPCDPNSRLLYSYQLEDDKPIEEKIYEYSNSNYIILALIIEEVSGLTYREYIETNIFTPLNMTNSYVYQEYSTLDDMTAADDENHPPHFPPRAERAKGYMRILFKWFNFDYNLRTVGDGGLYFSIQDFSRWLRGVADILENDPNTENALGVSFETYTSLFDDGVPLNEKCDDNKYYRIPGYYGYGWLVNNDRTAISHGGGWRGFTSFGKITGAFNDDETQFNVHGVVGVLSNGRRALLQLDLQKIVDLAVSVATIFDGIALKIVDGSRHTPE